jgi:hypothetical protein
VLSRDSSVAIVTRIWAGRLRDRGSIPRTFKSFFSKASWPSCLINVLSRDSSVAIVTRIWAGWQKHRGSIPRIFKSLFQKHPDRPWFQPPPMQLVSARALKGGKAAKAWSWPVTSILCRNWELFQLSLHILTHHHACSATSLQLPYQNESAESRSCGRPVANLSAHAPSGMPWPIWSPYVLS